MAADEIEVAHARALLLHAQGMASKPARATKAKLLETIRRMGLLQIDTISVVARSPYLVLWSRLGAYENRWLDELLEEGKVFEYWSHAVCFLPIEDYPLYRHAMLDWANENQDALAHPSATHVLEKIRQQGAVRSSDFASDQKRGTWWDWKPEKLALERLIFAGELMIARREGFQRVYDLRERVLPGWDDSRMAPADAARRELVERAVRALGAARSEWVRWYFKHVFGSRQVEADLAQLCREGAVVALPVRGWKKPAYVHRETLPLLDEIRAGRARPKRTAILSMFDPIVSNRSRLHDLFGVHYRIEVYTPAEKRQFGYFTMPILHRDRIVGRIDAKAHRKEGVFEVKSLHWEPGVEVPKVHPHVVRSIEDCAAWHKTPEVLGLDRIPAAAPRT